MNMKTNQPSSPPDPFAGFFGSLLLAFLASNMLASMTAELAFQHLALATSDIWKANLSAGFFVGFVLADPVGMLILKSPLKRAATKFVVGFLIGILMQVMVVMPLAGDGLSRYLLLIFAALLLPVLYCIDKLRIYLEARQIIIGDILARHGLRIMSWSDRGLIVTIMVFSFAVLWFFGSELRHVLIALAVILASTTIYVAFARPEEPIEDQWFYLGYESADQAPLQIQAITRLKQIARNLMPGAVLLGGITRIAAEVLLQVFPNMSVGVGGLVQLVNTLAMLVASGLGLVLFGMLCALGFGLGVITLLGKIGNWPGYRMKECNLRLIRVMCFRPFTWRR